MSESSPRVTGGVDVIAISRIRDALAEFGDSFRQRAFTEAERLYCEGQAYPAQHYAARWAVKEAFRKAVTTPPPFDSIGVRRSPADGAPTLKLGPEARRAVQSHPTPPRVETHVSLSHDRAADIAMAQVVLVGDAGDLERSET